MKTVTEKVVSSKNSFVRASVLLLNEASKMPISHALIMMSVPDAYFITLILTQQELHCFGTLMC